MKQYLDFKLGPEASLVDQMRNIGNDTHIHFSLESEVLVCKVRFPIEHYDFALREVSDEYKKRDYKFKLFGSNFFNNFAILLFKGQKR